MKKEKRRAAAANPTLSTPPSDSTDNTTRCRRCRRPIWAWLSVSRCAGPKCYRRERVAA